MSFIFISTANNLLRSVQFFVFIIFFLKIKYIKCGQWHGRSHGWTWGAMAPPNFFLKYY